LPASRKKLDGNLKDDIVHAVRYNGGIKRIAVAIDLFPNQKDLSFQFRQTDIWSVLSAFFTLGS
jgi:hypothetical protein